MKDADFDRCNGQSLAECASNCALTARSRDHHVSSGPSEQDEEFRQHHGGGAPDARAGDLQRPARRCPGPRGTSVNDVRREGSHSSATPTSRIRATSPSAGVSDGRASAAPTIGCSRKPLTGMSIGVSAPRRRTASGASAISSCASRSAACCVGLSGLGHAARQRHLAAVAAERVGANRQDDVRILSDREDEEQAGRVADARRVEIRRATRGEAAAPSGRARCAREAAGRARPAAAR